MASDVVKVLPCLAVCLFLYLAVQADLVNLLDLNLLQTAEDEDEDDGVEVEKLSPPPATTAVISQINSNSDEISKSILLRFICCPFVFVRFFFLENIVPFHHTMLHIAVVFVRNAAGRIFPIAAMMPVCPSVCQ